MSEPSSSMEAKLAALDLSHAPRDESAPRYADADDERPDTSTCWFDRLPYELKYKIARICHDMDLEGRESALHWKKYGNFGPSTTVGALFQVSKEWSDIVAPIHFEVGRYLCAGRDWRLRTAFVAESRHRAIDQQAPQRPPDSSVSLPPRLARSAYAYTQH